MQSRKLPLVWPTVWAILYAADLILGLVAVDSLILTFTRVGGIFLCLVYAVIRFPRDHFLQLALLATSIADVLLAINNTAVSGVSVFLIAQLIHLVRLGGKTVRTPLIIVSAIGLVTLGGTLYFRHLPLWFLIFI